MKSQKFPPWLHKKLPQKDLMQTDLILKKNDLSTVCLEAKCPNRLECFSQKRATFLALGNKCTRRCKFCAIGFCKNPPPPDKEEPKKIALCIQGPHRSIR